MDTNSFASTADGHRWARQRRELDSLIAQGLALPEIANELKASQIPADEVARAVRNKSYLVNRYRMAAEWSHRLLTAARSTVEQRNNARLPPLSGLALGVLIVILYFALVPLPWSTLPIGLQLFAGFATAGVFLLAGLIARNDLLMLLRTVESAQAPRDWNDRFLFEMVVPELRQYIAEQRKPVYGSTLSVDRPQLAGSDETPTIVTSAGRQLRRILDRSTAEAVAIAGSRGVGKTTTIRAVADGLFSDPDGPPPLSVITAAPSRYEARDFVLHLHVVLCQQITTLTSALLLLPAEKPGTPRRWARRLAGPAAGVLVLAAFSGFALVLWRGSAWELLSTAWQLVFSAEAHSSYEGWLDEPTHIALSFAFIVVFGIVLMAITWLVWGSAWLGGLSLRRSRRRRRALRYPGLVELRAEAFEELRRVRFLQTYTSGWSGKIGMPFNTEAGWNASMQRAEQNLTFPEVVDKFRRFAGRSATTLISNGVIERVVIAIDEVDKIAEPAQAHELVNDIKGIFGVPGCLFLVAVSDDALSAFEQRGMPVRDAFDSAFTQMVRMDNFTLAETRRWLSRPLSAVPEQFTYLLHCLSGGLPRELRRISMTWTNSVSTSPAS